MRVNSTIRVRNQAWRYDPATGFLRCTAVILRAGSMEYTREEMSAPADVGVPGQMLRVMVPLDEMSKVESVQSLEGMPVVEGHVWQTSDSRDAACGAIAGAPRIVGSELYADILVTDREIARRIMLDPADPDALQEISSAFDAMVNWDSSMPECDGHFSGIRYNHVAILPAGHARGGSSVRIVNTEKPKMDFTRIKFHSGRFVRVANEDLPAIEAEMKETEEKVANAPDAAKVGEMMDELKALRAETDEKNKRIEELQGQLKAYMDQLAAAMSPETIEMAANEMAAEKDAAAAVMNAHGLTLTAEQKALRGHALRCAVVRAVNSGITDQEAENEGFVRGLFHGYSKVKAVPPAGHQAAQVVNEAQVAAPDLSQNSSRFARLYTA